MSYETLELKVNRNLIVDAVAPQLMAFKAVPHRAVISNIQFSDLFGYSAEEFCKLKVFYTIEKEVELTTSDGTST